MDVLHSNLYYFYPIQTLNVFYFIDYDIYNLYAVIEHEPGVNDTVNTIQRSASQF